MDPIMENPIKMDDLVFFHLFLETSIFESDNSKWLKATKLNI